MDPIRRHRPFTLYGRPSFLRRSRLFFYHDDPEIFLRHCRRFEGLLRHAGFSITSEVETDYFRRFFLDDGNNTLKIERILEPRPSLGSFCRLDHAVVDSPENLAVNKLNALIGRNLARDLYDLWHLEGTVSFSQALDLSGRLYGSVGREDLLVVAGRIQAPDELPVHATRVPDLKGFSSFLSRISNEVLRRLSLESEEIKKNSANLLTASFGTPPHPKKR